MNKEELILTEDDLRQFTAWLTLDVDAITWQGRHREDFFYFWNNFFAPDQSLGQISWRFKKVQKFAKSGPLQSWFSWLEEQLIIFCFGRKGASILELTEESNFDTPEVASIVRNALTDFYPAHEEEFDHLFQMGNPSTANVDLRFVELSSSLSLDNDDFRHDAEGIMTSLEVTLYSDWQDVLTKSKKAFFNSAKQLKDLKDHTSLKSQLRFIKELTLMLGACLLLIWGIREINKWSSENLIEKIKIYEPQFLWSDQTLSFKEYKDEETTEETYDLRDFDEAINEQQFESLLSEASDFSPESEVVVASLDSLPKDFDRAELEQSEYEETRNVGYRDTRYGKNIVYRVMMRTVDPLDIRSRLDSLLHKYDIKQVDNVRPGTMVPGGIYYNLFVARNFLKEFLAEVTELDEVKVFESNVRGRNPPGQNKVFIWVKNI